MDKTKNLTFPEFFTQEVSEITFFREITGSAY